MFNDNSKEFKVMLHWSAVFFILALIAAILGFSILGAATTAAAIAKILFFIFLVAFVVALLVGVFRRPY